MRYVALCAVAAFGITLGTRATASDEVRGSLRVICVTDWDAAFLEEERVPKKLTDTEFDVSLKLADIPSGSTAREVEALAARRSGRRGPNDWTSRVTVLRADSPRRRIRVGTSTLRDSSLTLMSELRDGDVLVFYGGVDRVFR